MGVCHANVSPDDAALFARGFRCDLSSRLRKPPPSLSQTRHSERSEESSTHGGERMFTRPPGFTHYRQRVKAIARKTKNHQVTGFLVPLGMTARLWFGGWWAESGWSAEHCAR